MLENRFRTNIRPGRSFCLIMLRYVGNSVRTWLLFHLKYRWVRVNGFIRMPWRTDLWSPNRDIQFGHCVQFGQGCIVHCDAKFGNKILVANNVAFVGRDDHRYDISGKTIWDSPRGDNYKIVIEDDVWIGHGAIILSGVTIGTGSVIAAGSVVIKNVPQYSIVGGNPAQVLRNRFSIQDVWTCEKYIKG